MSRESKPFLRRWVQETWGWITSRVGLRRCKKIGFGWMMLFPFWLVRRGCEAWTLSGFGWGQQRWAEGPRWAPTLTDLRCHWTKHAVSIIVTLNMKHILTLLCLSQSLLGVGSLHVSVVEREGVDKVHQSTTTVKTRMHPVSLHMQYIAVHTYLRTYLTNLTLSSTFSLQCRRRHAAQLFKTVRRSGSSSEWATEGGKPWWHEG